MRKYLCKWLDHPKVHIQEKEFAMRFLTTVFFVAFSSFFSLQVAWAQDHCPGIDSPEATAIKYKLFTAFQTGFDGYETPCELKCFGKSDCQQKCQSKEGLRLLEQKLHEIAMKNNSTKCPSHTLSCLEQCKDLGVSCAAVCGQEFPVAEKSPASLEKKL